MRAVLALLLLTALVGVLPADAEAQERSERRGVLFVHGGFGSGGQFESQTLRFASNGYRIDLIRAVDYDSVAAGQDPQTAFPDIDQAIAKLKTDTRRDQVDVLGHSLGTTVMQAYLRSSPERARNVANYVNIDGRQSDDQPGGVRTLALWAEIPIRTNDRARSKRIGGGAENVYLPDQTHVQAATSEEAFAAMYRFFTGVAPKTTKIVPTPGPVSVAGRALVFPQNVAVTGQRVNFWPIDPITGARTTERPEASAPVSGPEGDFGPVMVTAGRQYEMELMRPNVLTIHYYFEPFLRSDNKVRLLYGEAIEAAIGPRGENVGGAVLLRYNEFRGDQATSNDVLEVNGLNVCTPVLCPTAGNVVGVFVYDYNGDGKSDLSRPNPLFDPLPFLTGADVFVPATRAPTGTTRVRLTPRGGGVPRTLAFPDFPSTTDQAFVYFNDFDQPTDLSAYARLPQTGTRRRCLSRRSPIGPRNIGRVRIGYTRKRLLRLPVRTPRKTRRSLRFCVKRSSGRVRAVFSRGRVALVATDAHVHGNRRLRPGDSVRALRSAYPGRRALGQGLYRVNRPSPRLIGTRNGKVRFFAVADRRLLRNRGVLKRHLRLAGL